MFGSIQVQVGMKNLVSNGRSLAHFDGNQALAGNRYARGVGRNVCLGMNASILAVFQHGRFLLFFLIERDGTVVFAQFQLQKRDRSEIRNSPRDTFTSLQLFIVSPEKQQQVDSPCQTEPHFRVAKLQSAHTCPQKPSLRFLGSWDLSSLTRGAWESRRGPFFSPAGLERRHLSRMTVSQEVGLSLLVVRCHACCGVASATTIFRESHKIKCDLVSPQ